MGSTLVHTAPVAPIFVVGAPRSGTTMLRYMLCAHPRIYIPPESNFIPRFFGRRPTTPLDRRRAVDIVREIERYRVFFKDWHGPLPDPAELVDELPQPTPAGIIDALYRRYASEFGAVRWGDKSPIYTRYVDLLSTIFPAARFVHIVRDGRDVATSMLHAYSTRRFFYYDIYYAARTWRHDVGAARESGSRLGAARYREVRYEDLVASPVDHLEAICAFLGERYESAMAHPEDVARRSYHSRGIHAATRQPVTTERAGTWRTGLSRDDVAVFDTVAGRLLSELCYEPRGGCAMTPRARVNFVRLRCKYTGVSAGRAALRGVGLFHPTELLARHLRLRPYTRPRACSGAAG
ncbi:MAG TPA: sulfotransferase [Acidimicrobiia bacterium]|nr:sulfotransferase [Acidimicrobiia bacterium]